VPDFAGINHIALTVRDLDVSERFYCDLLDFMLILDVGYGRICIHRPSGFTIALLRPDGADGERFSPLRTGLDHIGLAASSREELVEWEQRLQVAQVAYTPIQDMPLGYHLNFADPDGIALEFQAPNAVFEGALMELKTDLSDEIVRARAAELLQSLDTTPDGSR
jgi:glyoxylase I family protein